MKILLYLSLLLSSLHFAQALDLSTPRHWLTELEKLPPNKKIDFIQSHQQDWPALRSPSWIERQTPEVKAQHQDDALLAFAALEILRDLVHSNFAVYENTRSELVKTLLNIADSCKAKGGHNNDVLALASEKIATHLALAQIAAQPKEAHQYTSVFIADASKHIRIKDWLKQRGSEDAFLHDKMPRIDTLTEEDEKAPFGVFFRLANGEETPNPPPFSYRSLIETSNVIRLHFDALNVEFTRTVILPMSIDYVNAGGTISLRPADPKQEIQNKLGADLSKYRHKLLRPNNATAHDLFNAVNPLKLNDSALEQLTRWLQ